MRRERQGTSHGVSIRVARGLYYNPRQFRSRPIEWEETVHADTGLLGLTTKHVYFAGPKKKFRVRYDRIVAFEPYNEGFGIMRDAQTARPQTFRTGDGWFAYDPAATLAQMGPEADTPVDTSTMTILLGKDMPQGQIRKGERRKRNPEQSFHR